MELGKISKEELKGLEAEMKSFTKTMKPRAKPKVFKTDNLPNFGGLFGDVDDDDDDFQFGDEEEDISKPKPKKTAKKPVKKTTAAKKVTKPKGITKKTTKKSAAIPVFEEPKKRSVVKRKRASVPKKTYGPAKPASLPKQNDYLNFDDETIAVVTTLGGKGAKVMHFPMQLALPTGKSDYFLIPRPLMRADEYEQMKGVSMYDLPEATPAQEQKIYNEIYA